MFNFFKKTHDPIKLWFETDIHCHVIPGIDDGASDLETSLKLIDHMHAWGINRIIASPHIQAETFENTPDTIIPPFEQLQHAIASKGMPIDISFTAEYRLDDFMMAQLVNNQIKPLPNNYLLVENSFMQERNDLDQVLFDLQVKGFQPILAHPERYSYYRRNPQRYRMLHDHGILFQCNLLSLASCYSSNEKEIVEKLAADKMVDFIGTDLHNLRHVEVIEAYLKTKDAQKHRSLLADIKNDKAFI